MSNQTLFLKSGFLRTPLQNGIGRYVCQLQRITLKFCKSHGASRGMRDFIEKDMLDFAKENPGIVVYLKPRRHRSPCIAAEYLNGDKETVSCHDIPREEIIKWLNLLRTKASNTTNFRLRKLWHTDNPSIQGPWTPYTNRDPSLNLASFPNKELSKTPFLPPTATEKLIELFQQQQIASQEQEKLNSNDEPEKSAK